MNVKYRDSKPTTTSTTIDSEKNLFIQNVFIITLYILFIFMVSHFRASFMVMTESVSNFFWII